MEKILIFGGVNTDILAKSEDSFMLKDSNVGVVRSLVGGVGRNIAVSLTRLGYEVDLVTVVPASPFGEMIMADLASRHVGTGLVRRGDFSDSIYVALEDYRGEMVGAVNHMKNLEALDPEYLKSLSLKGKDYDLLVCDTNITQEALAWVVALADRPCLALEGVSNHKVLKAKPFLSHIDLLKINEGEALSLTGCDTPEEALKSLIRQGVGEVHITLGPRGALGGDVRHILHSPALPLKAIQSVNQAGDNYFAGVIHGILKGLTLEEKILHGQTLAVKRMMEG